MNLSYLKYAVEVEKTGSITKAAQNYYMNQPHLSKIIRELERDLGPYQQGNDPYCPWRRIPALRKRDHGTGSPVRQALLQK